MPDDLALARPPDAPDTSAPLWRPMEAAPKDGTPILARLARSGLFFRVAWNGVDWGNDLSLLGCEFDAWRPCRDGVTGST